MSGRRWLASLFEAGDRDADPQQTASQVPSDDGDDSDDEEDTSEEGDEEEGEEDDDGEEDEEEGDLLEVNGPLWFMHGGHMGRTQRAQLFSGCRKLSELVPEPLSGEEQPIVMHIHMGTAGAGPRHTPLLGRSCAPKSTRRRLPQRQPVQQQPTSPNSSGIVTRSRAAAAVPSEANQGSSRARTRASSGRARGRPIEGGASAGDAGGASSTRGGGGGGSGSGSGSAGCGFYNTARLLAAREYGLSGASVGFGRAQQRHLICDRRMPVHARKIRDKMDSRAYIGQYSPDGRFFVAAFQDKRVRLYDTTQGGTSGAATSGGGGAGFGSRSYSGSGSGSFSLSGSFRGGGGYQRGGSGGGDPAGGRGGGGQGAQAGRRPAAHQAGGWRLRKDVTTRMTRWTITDTTLSPDNRFLVYTTIAPVAYMVHVGGPLDLVESMANVTEIHEALNFVPRREVAGGNPADDGTDDDSHWGSFGIWSVAWSPGGSEIIAGTNDRSVNVYHFETKRTVARLMCHSDDVNAVCYLEDTSPNIICSGSDDSTIKVWDRRQAGATCRRPVGVLLGHTEGLTHLSPRGDGRYLLSNSKDQTAKLWDVRALRTPAQLRDLPPASFPRQSFDYRWQSYPAAGFEVRHPHDSSIQTYRGHKVLQTLIRAYFSPAHSTGQRYVYSGSSCGGIHVWDVVTARQVAVLRHHRAIVRDCSWHPHDPELASVSWDGTVVQWDCAEPGDGPEDAAEAALRHEAAANGDRFDAMF